MSPTLITVDGLVLHLRNWPCSPSRGTVLIVHGLGEHAGRYRDLVAALNGWGWDVVAYDQRGHGLSGGARGHIGRSDVLLADLAYVIDAVRARYPGRLLLLGHSLGGLLAARFVAERLQPRPAAWARAVEGLVLSSPALATHIGGAQRLLLRTLDWLAPDLIIGNGLQPAWMSRDPATVSAYLADPLVHDRITPRLACFIVDGGALVCALASRWQVPTLLMWAGADRCVAPHGSAAFALAAPARLVEGNCFDELAHELFNEPERAEVYAYLGNWLRHYAAAAASERPAAAAPACLLS